MEIPTDSEMAQFQIHLAALIRHDLRCESNAEAMELALKAVDAIDAELTSWNDIDPPHQLSCICADCSGAELTTRND